MHGYDIQNTDQDHNRTIAYDEETGPAKKLNLARPDSWQDFWVPWGLDGDLGRGLGVTDDPSPDHFTCAFPTGTFCVSSRGPTSPDYS